MSRRNEVYLVLIILLATGLAAHAQSNIKREADYLSLRRAAAARIESEGKKNTEPPRRQTVARRAPSSRSAADATTLLYFTKDDKVAGRTISDYSSDFLQFLFSRPIDPKYAEFEKQSKGMEFQHGPVWFLTPTSNGEVEREVVMSKNTPVFFSLGWAFGFLDDWEPDENMLGLQGFLSTVPEAFTDFEVSLDYEPLPREAIIATQSSTTYFPLLAETAEAFGIGTMSRVYSRAAMGGNFVMLKPLSAGTHVLKIRFNDVDGNRHVREYYLCVL